ncbi:MAG: GNAT family N-acetyltransferase [Halieaceae bacterium]|jgi:predicted N-acyltransferase
MELFVHGSIADIPKAEWSAWFDPDYPFLRHDFLLGLERSECTTQTSGWVPFHLVLREHGRAIAAAPGFLKGHSYGEYVFDWAWADAWHRQGLEYYPKVVSAVPFTPATGPRIWTNPSEETALELFLSAVTDLCKQRGITSWHILFNDQFPPTNVLPEDGSFVERTTCQFHWFNRDYKSFDEFLGTFSSRKRKNLRKERDSISRQGLSLTTHRGSTITTDQWQFFHYCYQTTYAKRSGHGGYLTKEFFLDVCPGLGDIPVMVIAKNGAGLPIAAALYFESSTTLYGRYWGCLEEYDNLHFEACYYRGIEYCIERGLEKFDPGAQGEHKIQRGFEPTLTRSLHWVAEQGFREPIAAFCRREMDQVRAYQQEACTLLPFKQIE